MLPTVRTPLNLLLLSFLLPIGCGTATSPAPADASATPSPTEASPVDAAPVDATAQSKPTAAAEPMPDAPLPDRDPALAHRLVDEHGAIVLDVRTQAEFDEGHVDIATLIPHDQLADRIAEVRKLVGDDLGKPIVLYCRSGKRAGEAKKVLLEQGFTHVTNLGGYTDW